MSSLTPVISSTQTNFSLRQAISDGTAVGGRGLFSPLVRVVTEYLFTEVNPTVWVAEYYGSAHAYDVLYDAITSSTCLKDRPAGLVVEYLRSSSILGLAELETSAGEGDREKGKAVLTRYLGPCNPEHPLPHGIDELMQAPFSEYFDADTVRAYPDIKQMRDLFMLHWCPARMTANIAEKLARLHGQTFDPFGWEGEFPLHSDEAIPADCWVLFPKRAFWGATTVEQQQARMPPGFRFPTFPIAAFCIFNTFNCTRTYIMSELYTRVDTKARKGKFAIGFRINGLKGNSGCRSMFDHQARGVAPMQVFYSSLSTGAFTSLWTTTLRSSGSSAGIVSWAAGCRS